MQAGASIRLFGRFELHLGDGAEVRLDIARAELLVTYLLLHRGAQPRRRLAFALWPDSTEAQAQTNLRKLLHTLRVRLPTIDRSLEITPRTIGWRAEAPVRVDVDEFEKLTAPGRRDRSGSERLTALRTAAALYRGDLLDGHDQAWLQPEQQRLRARHLEVLDELADLCAADGELAEAVTHAERRLRGDPLREASYRTLMRLHADHGDRARALGVYHECATVLENELGVAPSAATRAAYAALLPREPSSRTDEPLTGAAPLVGRTAERRQLVDVWRAGLAGRPQFVLLTGEAGVGKTRLAEDFRMWCARQGALIAEARCHAAEGPLVYGPVTAWLRSSALRPRLALLDRARRSELARLLPELLTEAPDTPKPEPLSADEQRRRLLDAVAAAVLSGRAPRLLVLDDVQHVDRETSRLLHYLLRREPTSHLVVVATARREEMDRDHPVQELRGRAARARPVRRDRARSPGPHRDRAAGAQARRNAGSTPAASTPRPRATRSSSSRPSAWAGRRTPPSAGACRPSSKPASASSATRPASWPRSRRRSGASSGSTCWPRRRAPTTRPCWTVSTSSGGAGSCGRSAPRSTGSATTRSARSPRWGSARRGGPCCTCGSPPRSNRRTRPTPGR